MSLHEGTLHFICGACWHERHGEEEPALRPINDAELCCFCGRYTNQGIRETVPLETAVFHKKRVE